MSNEAVSAQIAARHQRACDAGLSSYLDPATGYSVLTARYLAERGTCCDQGCRHCPYGEAKAEA
ncbi:MAG: DUF5522 domain-containing protein [Acidimicrobiales bacterium]